ncbi:MAG TPA: adenine deaminase C-terminal domain-containing protein [Pseudogracilibacillus sp.]|nr:adenine deaminase C-terminal domain-containing protein [Pseudogracilibacillus sp.]
MLEFGQFWRNRELREHIAVVDDKLAPTILLTNCTYLNVHTKKWVQANIWIYKDRIVYVGERMPKNTDNTEIIDCIGQYVVPGYMEPHAHPFQLYNPEEFAFHAAKFGTTTLINDNLRIFSLIGREKSLEFIETFNDIPISMFWWGRYDPQTMLRNDEQPFDTENLLDWLEHPSVIQGGELTSWPQLLTGDDRLLYWIQETKRMKKRVEGHFPGSSENTLTKLKLLGASADHESLTGADVLKRLQIGYYVALRHSSIRPDLENILTELLEAELTTYDQLMYTTDGSTPSYSRHGLINVCVEIALRVGVPVEEAYRMASYNVASYYHLDEVLGSIAPGRLAHINILYDKKDPHPLSVLAKGKWIVKDGVDIPQRYTLNWKKYGIEKVHYDWDLTEDDLQFSIPVGLKMTNDVITHPYAVEIDITADRLPVGNGDAFLLLIDRNGKWRVNSVLHGFTTQLGGLCSSFSLTGDPILIGKNKRDMMIAWNRMKEIGGGLVLVHNGDVLFELPLSLAGVMYDGKMDKLIEQETEVIKLLQEAGYPFEDPMYTLLFLSSTHLPYIRITPQGIVDVMKQEVIVPANMR